MGVQGCTQHTSRPPKSHSPVRCRPSTPMVTRTALPQFLAFPCGLLRGALSTLGIESRVSASVATLPACELGRGFPIPFRWGSAPRTWDTEPVTTCPLMGNPPLRLPGG